MAQAGEQAVEIDASTGYALWCPWPSEGWSGRPIRHQQTGVFWWNGGFGQPSGAGGPPLRTLAEWAEVFSSDFDDSELIQVSIGVGTFNQGQIGYFDDVQIVHNHDGGYDKSYDFEPQIGPPLDKDECKKGGWMSFNTPVFRNQGDCVSFVASSGRARRNN
jgi:hypothetical protein